MRTKTLVSVLAILVLTVGCSDDGDASDPTTSPSTSAASTIAPVTTTTVPPTTTTGAPIAAVCTGGDYAETLTGALFAQDEVEWMIELSPEQAQGVAESMELSGPDGTSSHVVFALVVGDCVGSQVMASGDGLDIAVTIGRASTDQPWEIISYASATTVAATTVPSIDSGDVAIVGVFDCGIELADPDGDYIYYVRFTADGFMYSISSSRGPEGALEVMQPGSSNEQVGPYSLSGDHLTGETVGQATVIHTGIVRSPELIELHSESLKTGSINDRVCVRVLP